jgi:opacity protein-like surface antigen
MTTAAAARAAEPPPAGLEVGVRTGYAFSAGRLGAPPNGTDNDVGTYVGGQWPIWLDAGYRFNRDLYLGGFFQYGFGFVNDDRQSGCRNANVDCSASDTRVGIMGRYHLPVVSVLSPWLGLGMGYEWGKFSSNQSLIGSSGVEYGWSGFEFANLQAGADYRVSSLFAVAPFISFSVGQFRYLSTTTDLGSTRTITDEDLAKTSLHEWIMFGVRASLTP